MWISIVATLLLATVGLFALVDEIGKRRDARRINTMIRQEAMRRMNEEWEEAARFDLHKDVFFWEVNRWSNDI